MNTQRILLLVLPVLLAACALEPKRAESPTTTRIIVQPATPSETDQLLAYAARIRKLSVAELGNEREQARSAFQRDKTDVSRVKYALLLAAAPASSSTDDDLASALDPILTATASNTATDSTELRTLAQVLHGMVSERRRLREQLRESQARLNLSKRDEVREGEARALRAKVDELEKRLDALKSIDRSVSRRTEAPTK
jgi:hypothetical protein